MSAQTQSERQKSYRMRHPERIKKYKRSHPDHVGNNRRNKRMYHKDLVKSRQSTAKRNALFRTTIHGAACYLYWNAHRRSKMDKLEFSITKEWIEAVLKNGKCQITGLPFSFGNGRRPWMPSLDKSDPNSGYTKDNVKVVVWLYNTAKAEFSHDDVITLAKALVKKEKCR